MATFRQSAITGGTTYYATCDVSDACAGDEFAVAPSNAGCIHSCLCACQILRDARLTCRRCKIEREEKEENRQTKRVPTCRHVRSETHGYVICCKRKSTGICCKPIFSFFSRHTSKMGVPWHSLCSPRAFFELTRCSFSFVRSLLPRSCVGSRAPCHFKINNAYWLASSWFVYGLKFLFLFFSSFSLNLRRVSCGRQLDLLPL